MQIVGEWDLIQDLELALATAVAESVAGEFDGNDFGAGWCTLYFYGSDARRLASVICLAAAGRAVPRGSMLIRRYGPPGAAEEQVPFNGDLITGPLVK